MANAYIEGAKMAGPDLLGLPVDTLLNLVDIVTAGAGVAGKELGIIDTLPELTNREKTVGTSAYIAKKLEMEGPKKGDELAYNVGRFGTGSLTGASVGGVGKALKGLIGGSLSGLTYTQAVEQYPDNPAIQMLGAMLPQVSAYAAKTGIKVGSVPGYIAATAPDAATTTKLGENYKQNVETLKGQGLTAATRGMASGDTGVLGAEQSFYHNPASKNVPQAAILKLAEQSKSSVNKIIDRIRGLADTTRAGAAVANATDTFIDRMVKLRSSNAENNFGAIQDKTTPVIPTQSIVTKLQEYIDEFKTGAPPASGAVSRDLNSRIVSELESMQARLTGRDISIGEAKTLLERYSKASVGKDKIFADLDWRTQERRVAGGLSEALNTDLDTSISSGVKDANALKYAREAYAADSAPISDFSKTVWGNYFNVDKPRTGTEVFDKFMGLPKESKVEAMRTLPKDVQESLQKTAQTELMKKAESPFSIQKGKPTWDTETWLKGLDAMHRNGDYNIIFSPEQRVAMKSNIDALRMTLREGSIVNEATPLGSTITDAARAGYGSRGWFGLKTASDIGKYLIGLDTETRASMMFSPLGESQAMKGFAAPTKPEIGAGIMKVQAASNPMEQPQKSVDDMSDEEVIAFFNKQGATQQPEQPQVQQPVQQDSVDNMSDEDVIKLYDKLQQENKEQNWKGVPKEREQDMRQVINTPMTIEIVGGNNAPKTKP